MKKLLAFLLSASFLFAAGCSSRTAQPAPTPESAAFTPKPAPASEPSPSPAPEPTPKPTPQFTEAKLSENDKTFTDAAIRRFVDVFGAAEPVGSTAELKEEKALEYCLYQLDSVKDLNAYFFEETGDGKEKIPQAMVTDVALKQLGIVNFFAGGSPLFEDGFFLYTPGAAPAPGNYSISSPQKTADQELRYEVTFYPLEDADHQTPTAVRVYTCEMFSQNGLPYLKLLSILEPEASDRKEG